MSGDKPQTHGVRCFKALSAAATDPRLSRSDVGCLAVLIDRYNLEKGAAWPSVNRLASEASLHRSNVIRALQRLEELGYITIARGGMGKANRYHPTFKSGSANATSSEDATSSAVATSGGAVTGSANATELVAPARLELVAPARPEHTHRTKPKNIPTVAADICSTILEKYHAILPRCRRCSVLNDKRIKRLQKANELAKAVCKTQQWSWDPNWFWTSYFEECAKDPWMRGEVPNPGNPLWRQNLDVLIAEDRFANVMDKAIADMGSTNQSIPTPRRPNLDDVPDWAIGVI
jgi:predicted transcriptional regulator